MNTLYWILIAVYALVVGFSIGMFIAWHRNKKYDVWTFIPGCTESLQKFISKMSAEDIKETVLEMLKNSEMVSHTSNKMFEYLYKKINKKEVKK